MESFSSKLLLVTPSKNNNEKDQLEGRDEQSRPPIRWTTLLTVSPEEKMRGTGRASLYSHLVSPTRRISTESRG